MAGALEGKVVVIMGGTSGLGLSGAGACVAAGGSVVVVGREIDQVRKAQEVLGERAHALAGDASDPQTAKRAIAAALERFGAFDGLYHVAGSSGRRWGDGPLDQISDEGWDKTLELNLTSLFYSNRAAVRSFLERGSGGERGGVVLNMSSVLGYSPAKFFATHAYAAAKSAVFGFTKACAAHYARDGIRFNVIAPGLMQTPMSRRAANDQETMSFIATKQPLDGGRIGQPSDLDGAVVYLLSDQSKFVTGQTLTVDGGWTISDGQHHGGAPSAPAE